MEKLNFHIIFFFLLLIASLPVKGQNTVCTGNLGENILQDGDFGSGEANVPRKPNYLISAYVYVWQAPPPVGYYLFTKNTEEWDYIFPTWMQVQDNSDDPNGYCMLVNGDNSSALFYERIIDGLCENTNYIFSVDIMNIVRSSLSDQVAPNILFLLDEEVIASTGNIQQNERWHSYTFDFTTQSGQTNIRLSLKNNAPAGDGNDFAIDNMSLHPCGPIIDIQPEGVTNICEKGNAINIYGTVVGDEFDTPVFQWQRSVGQENNWERIENANSNSTTHTEKIANNYYYRYLVANTVENLNNPACRVSSDTKVVKVIAKEHYIKKTICSGSNFVVGTSVYSQSGTYVDSLQSSLNCDSIITLELTVLDDLGIEAMIEYDHPNCSEGEDGFIHIFDIQNAHSPYTVALGTQLAADTVRFAGLQAGNHELLIKDSVGCNFQRTIELIDPEPFTFNLGENKRITLGEGINIFPTSNQTIKEVIWSDTNIDNTTSIFYPTSSTYYSAKGISALNCEAIDSIFIQVDPIRKIYIPSVFSPNGDGINDYFSIFAQTPNVQEIIHFAIFDRWGNLIFERKNLIPENTTNLWDGMINGQPIKSDNYLYFATVSFLDGKTETIGGEIMILR